MDKSTRKSDVCLLRKPLPPSDDYKIAFQTSQPSAATCTSISYSSANLPNTRQTYSAQVVNRVPFNTPYRRLRYHEEEEEMVTIYPLVPKGPPPLPPGKILSQRTEYLSLLASWSELEDNNISNSPPEFTFNDFLLSSSDQIKMPKTNRAMISRENYLKLTSWLATHKPTQATMSTWEADST